jgi:hypothetical protein
MKAPWMNRSGGFVPETFASMAGKPAMRVDIMRSGCMMILPWLQALEFVNHLAYIVNLIA